MKLDKITNESLRTWLRNHQSAVDMGYNVGQIDRNKAQTFRLELIRRGARIHA